jgi:preprotein translocase subunit YajC
MSLFISDAFAAAAEGAPSAHADGSFSLLMVVGIFVLFYLMIIRPQNKRAKEHRNLINQVKAGDEVVTVGGMLGKVMRVDEQYVTVSISEGVDVILQRNAVSSVLPKGTLKSL